MHRGSPEAQQAELAVPEAAASGDGRVETPLHHPVQPAVWPCSSLASYGMHKDVGKGECITGDWNGFGLVCHWVRLELRPQ